MSLLERWTQQDFEIICGWTLKYVCCRARLEQFARCQTAILDVHLAPLAFVLLGQLLLLLQEPVAVHFSGQEAHPEVLAAPARGLHGLALAAS